jgi:hypothetical protein
MQCGAAFSLLNRGKQVQEAQKETKRKRKKIKLKEKETKLTAGVLAKISLARTVYGVSHLLQIVLQWPSCLLLA